MRQGSVNFKFGKMYSVNRITVLTVAIRYLEPILRIKSTISPPCFNLDVKHRINKF
jgi:hypothetical protein